MRFVIFLVDAVERRQLIYRPLVEVPRVKPLAIVRSGRGGRHGHRRRQFHTEKEVDGCLFVGVEHAVVVETADIFWTGQLSSL